MYRYFKRALESPNPTGKNDDNTKSSREEFDPMNLEADPGKRIPISDYHANIRDDVRRAYIAKGPCQPNLINFPCTKFGEKQRRFNRAWYLQYANWLEYSEKKDAAFCLCCYLFKPNIGDQGGGDYFVGEGFRNWKKKEKFDSHVGGHNSAHCQAWNKFEALRNQKQHIEHAFMKQTDQTRREYLVRLNASIDCVRFLLQQGLAFRGDDESDNSRNQGNFLELLKFIAQHNDDINSVTLKNAPENLKLTAPSIQKDIVNAIAVETINIIMKDIGDAFFSILVDESRDISIKEQMAIVLRYVNKNGCVIERFVGIEHVTSTTSLSLKDAIDRLFSRHGLSISRLRGQGYDGASNMQGEFNGLKTLILKENPYAFYIHCFAHQIQLALVAVA